MDLLFAVGADHHGEGIVDHVLAKSHAGDGVVDDFRKGSAAGGAVARPFGVILGVADFFAADGEVFATLEEVTDALAGFFGEALGHVFPARDAHGVFEDAFWAFEDFSDGVGMIDFGEGLITGETGVEGFVVLERMEEWRNITHAEG